MKAALAIVFASLLAFPLAFAMAARHGASPCPADMPCLPREFSLTPEQQDALKNVYARNRRQQAALEQQTRSAVLAVLTPAQRQQLLAREPRFDTVVATPQAQR